MSETDVNASEVRNEKEIVIDLEDKNEVKNEITSETVNEEQTKPKMAKKIVERKQIVDLNDEEKAIIVNNAKNGYDQPNFDVKFFKNGKYRILKKKEQVKSVAQKVVSSSSAPEKEKKVFYSDNQLLFEHIIELNSKVEKLMTKHKKLKRKYQTLQNDIYAEDDEIPTAQQIEEPKTEVKNEVVNEPPQMQQMQPPIQQQPITNKRMNWRARLSYL